MGSSGTTFQLSARELDKARLRRLAAAEAAEALAVASAARGQVPASAPPISALTDIKLFCGERGGGERGGGEAGSLRGLGAGSLNDLAVSPKKATNWRSENLRLK